MSQSSSRAGARYVYPEAPFSLALTGIYPLQGKIVPPRGPTDFGEYTSARARISWLQAK